MRALQAFMRLAARPAPAGSRSASPRARRSSSSTLVTAAPDVTLTASGDAEVVAAPGAVTRELVELLLDALEQAARGTSIELTVSVAGDDAVAAVAGIGERRFPLA